MALEDDGERVFQNPEADRAEEQQHDHSDAAGEVAAVEKRLDEPGEHFLRAWSQQRCLAGDRLDEDLLVEELREDHHQHRGQRDE